MSKLTHYFDLNVPKVEHHLVSESDALTITAQASAGEGETFLASKHGASNHVAGFKTGEDKILVPLELLKELNPATTFVKGPCPAAKYVSDPMTDDAIFYVPSGEVGYSYTNDGGDTYPRFPLIMLDGAPALAAADIEII